jgi:hypothetical protein
MVLVGIIFREPHKKFVKLDVSETENKTKPSPQFTIL